MRTAFLGLMASAFVVWGCTPQRVSAPAGASAPAAGPPTAGAPAAGTAPTTGAAAAGTASTADSCSSGKPLTVHFLNVGQGLSVLVDLPNDKHILVDAGPSSSVVDSLKTTLSTTNLDWLWITHQHTDHYGGARAVLKAYTVDTFIDNGESSDKTTEEALHKLVAEKNATYVVVSPTKRQLPNLDTGLVKISLAAPSSWPVSNCDGDNANNCSIGLRLDFCKSSVLLVGDAEQAEEAQLIGTVGPAT